MRWLFRILFVIAVVVIAFTFSMKNQSLVDVHFWEILSIQGVQLGFVIIAAFAAGLIAGYVLILKNKLFSSVKTGSVQRKLKKAEQELVATKEKLNSIENANA